MRHTGIALVIGGGIAGPAAAMALQKAGIDSVVYEAHPTGAEGIGVFLTLASNGVDALRVLGADGPALATGFPTPGITLRSGTGKRLGESRTGDFLPDGTTSQTLKRADLYGCCTRRQAAGAYASSTASAWSQPRRLLTGCGRCSPTAPMRSATC